MSSVPSGQSEASTTPSVTVPTLLFTAFVSVVCATAAAKWLIDREIASALAGQPQIAVFDSTAIIDYAIAHPQEDGRATEVAIERMDARLEALRAQGVIVLTSDAVVTAPDNRHVQIK